MGASCEPPQPSSWQTSRMRELPPFSKTSSAGYPSASTSSTTITTASTSAGSLSARRTVASRAEAPSDHCDLTPGPSPLRSRARRPASDESGRPRHGKCAAGSVRKGESARRSAGRCFGRAGARGPPVSAAQLRPEQRRDRRRGWLSLSPEEEARQSCRVASRSGTPVADLL